MIEEVRIPVSEPTSENVNKVPDRQWRKWSEPARRVFNRHFTATSDASVLVHPDSNITEGQWKTIRWNTAWLAADAVDGSV